MKDAYEIAVFALYTLLLLVGVSSTVLRILRFWRAGIPRPSLIWRDVAVAGGFALTSGIVFWHRILNLPFRAELWYAIVSSVPALGAAGAYVYWELRVIGRRPKSSSPERELMDAARDEHEDVGLRKKG